MDRWLSSLRDFQIYISHMQQKDMSQERSVIIYRFKNYFSPIIASVSRDYHRRGSRIKRKIGIKSNCVSLRNGKCGTRILVLSLNDRFVKATMDKKD